jgi:hypothetical protein
MKNKKNIYILLPLVLLIWGAVMYQFFSFSNSSLEEIKHNEEPVFKPLVIKKREPVILEVQKRDPFLGKFEVSSASNRTVTSVKRAVKNNSVVAKKKDPIIWPIIIYKGIVSDTKDKNKVFMLVIDGRTFLMRTKNKENEVLLIEGDRETIEVVYKNESKFILIEE